MSDPLALLGIGAKAWAELAQIEQDGLRRRNIDSSGMPITWGTFRLVMEVLRDRQSAQASPGVAQGMRVVTDELWQALTSGRKELVAAVLALDPAAADDQPYGAWDAAKWRVFNAAVRAVKEPAVVPEDVQADLDAFQRWRAQGKGGAPSPPAWQPIETAPKDGSRFLAGYRHHTYGWLWDSCRRVVTDPYHPGGYWIMTQGGEPTHWLSLPDPPVAALDRAVALPEEH